MEWKWKEVGELLRADGCKPFTNMTVKMVRFEKLNWTPYQMLAYIDR